MNKERVLALLSMLEDLKKNQRNFDWSEWGHSEESESPDKLYKSCKTTACIGGWAALHPWFRERGLKTASELIGEKIFDFIPMYKGKGYGQAMYRFLDMDEYEIVLAYSCNNEMGWFCGGPDSKINDAIRVIRESLRDGFKVDWWNDRIELEDQPDAQEDPAIENALKYTTGAD